MTAPLPDAAPTNWVDRSAPAALRPWLKLGRFDRPAGIWLLMLPGWQGVALANVQWKAVLDVYTLMAIFFGAALMRAAGCAYNDIVDRDIDAKVARTAARPVASGQISVLQAWIFIGVCALLALVILLSLGKLAIWLGVASLALVAIYPFMKRITWWPQAWLGLTFNWGVLLGYAATSGMLTEAAFILYAAGFFWTLGYDTIYAVQDIEDDALAGVKSSARRLGGSLTTGVAVFYALAALLAGLAGWRAGLGLVFYVGLAAYAGHLFWQLRGLSTDDPAGALKRFKSNSTAGLILFAAIVMGFW